MSLNTSALEVIAARREQVARLRLRQATQADIARALGVCVGTVNGDLAALRDAWRAAASVDTAEHQARILAELREARRVAWQQPPAKGLPLILQALRQECELLGLNAQPISAPGDTLMLSVLILQALAEYPDARVAVASLLAEPPQLVEVLDAGDE